MILKEHFVTACFVQYPESAITIFCQPSGMQDFSMWQSSGVQQTVFFFYATRCTVGIPSLSMDGVDADIRQFIAEFTGQTVHFRIGMSHAFSIRR